MKVTSWNLLHGAATPGVNDEDGSDVSFVTPARASDLLAHAAGHMTGDVFGLQEVDRFQPRSGELHQIEFLANALGASAWAFAPTIIGTPGESWRKNRHPDHFLELAHQPSSLRERSYGIGMISKIPVVKWHHLELGRSLFGLPLAVPTDKGVRPIYVKDEPRVAIAAELTNGFTVAVTHLSFVPLVNVYQLRKIQKWLGAMPGKKILMGDLNLPFGIPEKVSSWRSLADGLTYPAWGAKVQFDYILAEDIEALRCFPVTQIYPGVSDHLPLSAEITDVDQSQK